MSYFYLGEKAILLNQNYDFFFFQDENPNKDKGNKFNKQRALMTAAIRKKTVCRGVICIKHKERTDKLTNERGGNRVG